MATPAASSESNRSAYSRNLELGTDARRLRFDSSKLPAFDMLLALPVVENLHVPNDTLEDRELTDESSDVDERDSSDEATGIVSANPNSVPFPDPVALSHEDALALEPIPRLNAALPSDKEPLEKLQKSPDTSIDGLRSVDIPSPQQEDRAKIADPQVGIELTGSESLQSQDRSSEVESPAGTTMNVVKRDQNANEHTESKTETPVRSDLATLDGQAPRTDIQGLERLSSSESQKAKPLPAELSKPLRRGHDPHAETSDRESLKRPQNGTPFVNRRSDRLADVKRGDRSNNRETGTDQKNGDIDDARGTIDIPKEASLVGEVIDPPSSLTISTSLMGAELIGQDSLVSEASPSMSAGIIAGVASNLATATSTLASTSGGLDPDKPLITNGAVSIQGSPTYSESPNSRSTAAFTGKTQNLSAYQEHRVLQRVLKGLNQLSEGGGQVRLRLHPPELGSLQITLRVESQQVSALIEVEHPAAREVLLGNLSQLQSRLSDQGLNVSQFDVQVVDPNQMGHGSDPGWEARDGRGSGHGDTESNRSSRYIDRLNNQLDRPSAEETARLVHSLWTRKNGELDVRF